MPVSPTAEGFRVAFRRPLLALGEITWRWAVGATATTLFFFGFFEYLRTLPINSGEMLLLRSRQPYLVWRALAHILAGGWNRAVMSALLAAMLLALLWMFAGSLGRIATVTAMLDYFRDKFALTLEPGAAQDSINHNPGSDNPNGAPHFSPPLREVETPSPLPSLLRLNFLRAVVALAAILGFIGAAILAGFASTAQHPRPGLVFFLFLPTAAIICLAWLMLNWLLSLAGMFAARDGEDALDAISSAVALCRERTGAVSAVSTWTWLAHVVAFVGATSVVSMPLGFAPIVPGRVVLAAMMLITLAYFMVADWLYTARLAGYVLIAELPDAMLKPPPPAWPTMLPPTIRQTPLPPAPTLQITIDRNEPILSDVAPPAPQITIDRDEPILSDVPSPPNE